MFLDFIPHVDIKLWHYFEFYQNNFIPWYIKKTFVQNTTGMSFIMLCPMKNDPQKQEEITHEQQQRKYEPATEQHSATK